MNKIPGSQKKIPFCDLKKQYISIKKEVEHSVKKTLAAGHYILGSEVEGIERAIAKYTGTKYAAGVASGTDALIIALIAAGLKTGDEVITSPLTFIATAEAVIRAGGKPVFADIDEHSYTINPADIEKRITKKTKFILPVHLYGHPADMNKIMKIAGKHKLKVIEDCAQAMGTKLNGRNTGSFGDAGCLSFFPAKNLGCFGDGGMIITNKKKIYTAARIIRAHGCEKKNFQEVTGFNSRLDSLQASVLKVKLKYLSKWIKKRISRANQYTKLLKEMKEIRCPDASPGATHSFNYYTIRILKGRKTRDKLLRHLASNGISCGIYYPLALHLQKTLKHLGYHNGDFPACEKAQDEILTLPMFPELTDGQIKFTTEVIKKFDGFKRRTAL